MGSMTTRRWVVTGMGVGGFGALGALATAAYRVAPAFWNQYWSEMKRDIVQPSARPDFSKWGDKGLHVAWLGHSTVLVKMDGFTFITDPVFSEKAGLHFGPLSLGVKRLVYPAADLKDLPKVDAVLVSHAHMDHFDIPSLRKLEAKDRELITAVSTSDLLRVGRYKSVNELRWGERRQVGPLTVQALQVNHWGARMRTDSYRGYNGYLIENGRYRVLFAGDTAATDAFREVRSSKPVDVAIMPIGAYNPWIRVHCNPEQAWRMGSDAGAELMIPVHHQTFVLSREPRTEPIERFIACAGRHDDRVPVRSIGQELHI